MIKFPILDGHNDTLTHIFRQERGQGRSFYERSDIGQLDLPRAMQGGLAGGVCAIYTPPPPTDGDSDFDDKMNPRNGGYEVPYAAAVDYDYARDFTLQLFDFVEQLEAEGNGRVAITRDYIDLVDNLKNHVFSIVLGIEGAAAISPDLSNLQEYYDRGLRVINPVWSRPNAFGYGVPFCYPSSPDTGPGLTSAGKALVKACNEMGILIDLAHLNEKGFWQVAELSNAPLVTSHTAAHAICPISRNITDEQIKAIGQSEGLIGIYYMPGGLRPDGKNERDTPLAAIVKHIDHIVDLIGIDYVALGSDFDGATMPYGLNDVSALPNLLQVLKNAGYDDDDLAKITHENWVHVFRNTWQGQ
ncbi:MAG: dipeptidase [Candidatus Promineifilaceae bacterium]